MVSNAALDQQTRERIYKGPKQQTKKLATSALLHSERQRERENQRRISLKVNRRPTFLNSILFHNGPIGLLFQRRTKFMMIGFFIGYGLRFWQNHDRKKQLEKEREEEKRRKKRKKPLIDRKARITEISDQAEEINETRVERNGYRQKKDSEMKMVLLVREDLAMSAGKVGAQCAHASLGLFQTILEFHAKNKAVMDNLQKWQKEGQKKVCLGIKSSDDLEDFRAAFATKRIPFYVVEDAGRTEIAAGSETVMAIGPCDNKTFDQITGKLRLYSR
jgi:peptidyl-tRNA hydrolase, PTH2 family